MEEKNTTENQITLDNQQIESSNTEYTARHPKKLNLKSPAAIVGVGFGILVLLIVFFIAFNSYIRSQELKPNFQQQETKTQQLITTPDPTANWQTYRNDKYDFSFKHPPSWKVSDRGDESGELYINFVFNTKATCGGGGDILVQPGTAANLKTKTDSVLTIDGIKAYSSQQASGICNGQKIQDSTMVETVKAGFFYLFDFGPGLEKDSENLKLFNEMLSTVKLAHYQPYTEAIQKDLGDFPIYPNAVFDKKTDNQSSCKINDTPNCYVNVYEFDINKSASQVIEWYNQNTIWQCNKAPYDGSNSVLYSVTCKKGNVQSDLAIAGGKDVSTLIISVPISKP